MEKRLNRSDLIFSLAFLLMLVIAVGAFFYGVKVGTDRVESKYAAPNEPEPTAPVMPNAYQQQDLVSFYHTVFLPYREFQNDWFDAQRKWLSDSTLDRAGYLDQLKKSAMKQYDAIKKVSVSNSSPLLVDAQTSYLKSLKLFSDSFSDLAKNANNLSADAFIQEVNANAYYKEGRIQALTGQGNYYDSMLKWAAMIDTDLPAEYESPDILSIAKWKQLPLIIKIKVSADYLSTQSEMKEFSPQDLTAKIDDFINSGQAEKRKLKSFSAIAELLTSTDGVRNGDFLQMKSRFYENEQLPQLPFFFSDN
ncbi:hypothetical protein [Cohnella yongneupensis]|uniref:Uncharacterized protein n=1 Tax=Cohnella yongneupensis TaxID=425006 RepID=A0ABW0R3H0_9BACL